MNRIKVILSAIALSTVPLVSGCTTLSNINTATNVCANTTADEKAWYAAEALYNVPAAAYRSANERFKEDPRWLSVKPTIKPKLQTLNQYRLGAKGAYKTCNLVALNQWSNAMTTLNAEVMPLFPH